MPIPDHDPAWNDVDIVVPFDSSLDVLNAFKGIARGYHFILVQYSEQPHDVQPPDWMDYEMHNTLTVAQSLGADVAHLARPTKAAARSMGVLMSKKKYVLTFDVDTAPAVVNSLVGNRTINAVMEHVLNLRTDATPRFVRTDSAQEGYAEDYPLSMQRGVKTAISNGCLLEVEDTRALLDASLLQTTSSVVPWGAFYDMTFQNVAFDRALIGPVMMDRVFSSNSTAGAFFAGIASKLVADHMQLGVKSGAPCMVRGARAPPLSEAAPNRAASAPSLDIDLLMHADRLHTLVDGLRSRLQCTSAASCYRSIAKHLAASGHAIDADLAKSIESWVQVWHDAQTGKMTFTPLRRSTKDMAVLGITRNEPNYLPAWLNHYRKWFPDDDIYILDNESTDGSTDNLGPVNIIKAACIRFTDHTCLTQTVIDNMQRLLDKEGYRRVIFAETDELVFAVGGLRPFLCNFNKPYARVTALGVYERKEDNMPRVDWLKSPLRQRNYVYYEVAMNKPSVTTVPLKYGAGFHNPGIPGDEFTTSPTEHGLHMLHLQRADREYYMARKMVQNNRTDWNDADVKAGLGWGALRLTGKELENFYDLVRPGAVRSEDWMVEALDDPGTRETCAALNMKQASGG